jgi:hypothetical protein
MKLGKSKNRPALMHLQSAAAFFPACSIPCTDCKCLKTTANRHHQQLIFPNTQKQCTANQKLKPYNNYKQVNDFLHRRND